MNARARGSSIGALLAATGLLLTTPAAAQGAMRGRLVTPGSFADDSARLASITSDTSLSYSLLRSASTLAPRLPGDHDVLRTAPILPELYAIGNSALPYSLNDGALWAGRGWSSRLRAGFRAEVGPVRLVVAPEFLRTEDLGFAMPHERTVRPRPPGRSIFASPWHTSPESIDLPLRFGARAYSQWDYGQSALDVRAGR